MGMSKLFSRFYCQFMQIVLVCCLIVGCKTTDNYSSLPNAGVAATSQSKIIFLTYEISKNKSGQLDLVLLQKIIADGTLKKVPEHGQNYIPGDLLCTQLDEHKSMLDQFKIDDPLVKVYEFANEGGELNKFKMNLKQSQFTIRRQLSSETRFVSIQQIGKAPHENILLLTTEI